MAQWVVGPMADQSRSWQVGGYGVPIVIVAVRPKDRAKDRSLVVASDLPFNSLASTFIKHP